jgi:invasion protein IalB
VALKPEPAQPAWAKVCGQDEANGKEICFTTRDFVAEYDQPLMTVAVYDVKGESEKIVRFRLPLSLRLQPGVRVSIDTGTNLEGKFSACYPNGCYAEVPVKDDFVSSMKKGKTLRVRTQNQMGEQVIFESPIEGFAKGYDGKALDPNELAEQQKKLQEALIERSEAMRKKFEAQQAEEAAKKASEATPAESKK